MLRSGQGSIRLFRFSGIDVFLHWSWFLVAAFEIQSRNHSYSSIAWNVLEYLALFMIVTLHEFWSRAGLPPSRREGRSNRSVATRRRSLCRSSTAAGSHFVEHRCRTSGECRPAADFVRRDRDEPVRRHGSYVA